MYLTNTVTLTALAAREWAMTPLGIRDTTIVECKESYGAGATCSYAYCRAPTLSTYDTKYIIGLFDIFNTQRGQIIAVALDPP